jgi:rhamnogalacturonyl hydrolase YesR
MLRYAKDEQVRLPDLNIYTRLTPEKYTTWVDDMFMGIPFLMQAAQYASTQAERNDWLNDAARQVLNFNKVVWNEDTKLYSHARYSEHMVRLPHWSRANGWGIWATTEVLNALPKSHPQYNAVLAHYQQHVRSLVKLQKENGFWLQLLDRPASPEEVSGTAIFTMAIARGIRQGWIPAATYSNHAEKGWAAIKSQMEMDGTVHNICYGTMCSEDENYYLQRPFYDDDTHGLFAVLFAGIEMHLMQQHLQTGRKQKKK